MAFYYHFTLYGFFKPGLASGNSLESEWQQVSSGIQDSSQYFGRPQQCCSFDDHGSSFDFQPLLSLRRSFKKHPSQLVPQSPSLLLSLLLCYYHYCYYYCYVIIIIIIVMLLLLLFCVSSSIPYWYRTRSVAIEIDISSMLIPRFYIIINCKYFL